MLTRVLFISYDGLTDPLGQSQILPYLKGLSLLGHSIAIVSAEKKDRYASRSASVKREIQGAGITWIPVTYSNSITGISAWVTYRRLRTASINWCRKEKVAIVHARSDIPAIIGLELKRKFGLKLLFDMRGFWADERIDGGSWNLSNPIYHWAYRYFKKQEMILLMQSDAVVSLTNAAKTYLIHHQSLRLAPEKIFVIPCCTDLDLFSPDRLSPEWLLNARRRLGINEEDMVITYAGSLGTWYMLDEMLWFFSLLLRHRPHAKFLIITQDSDQRIVQQAVTYSIPAEKIVVASAERDEMPVLLSLSHLAIFFIKNSFSKIASSPTKMGETLALGIPLICNAGVGDVSTMVVESGTGICIADFSEASLSRLSAEAVTLLQIPKSKIREVAKRFFSLSSGVNEYHRIYAQLS